MKIKKYLLHVGYPKAGSTLLGDWFDKHPSIGFSDFTIGGIKDTNALIQLSKIDASAQPDVAVVRDMRFSIPRIEEIDLQDISKIKKDQQRICETLYSFFPNSKVLIVTRGYKSLISANYSQYIKEGGTYNVSEIQKFTFLLKELFDYSYLVEQYIQKFGSDNVLVLPFELLKDDSLLFFDCIEKHLDIPHHEFKPLVLNPSLTLAEAKRLRQKSLFVERFTNRFGAVGERLKRRYIESRRKKAFDWDSTEIENFQVKVNNPLVELDEIMLSQFYMNSGSLKNYPVFKAYYTHYGIS